MGWGRPLTKEHDGKAAGGRSEGCMVPPAYCNVDDAMEEGVVGGEGTREAGRTAV